MSDIMYGAVRGFCAASASTKSPEFIQLALRAKRKSLFTKLRCGLAFWQKPSEEFGLPTSQLDHGRLFVCLVSLIGGFSNQVYRGEIQGVVFPFLGQRPPILRLA